MIEQAQRERFTRTFEAYGENLLFEDLVVSYYMPGESFQMWAGGSLQTFVENSFLVRLREEGRSRTVADSEKAIADLSAHTDVLLAEIPILKTKESFTYEELAHALKGLGRAFTLYMYFDPWYWDGVYEAAGANPKAQKNIELVQGFKNVVRKRFDPLCFERSGYLYSLLEILSRQFGISVDELDWYREAELYGLFENKKLSDEELAARRQAYVYYVYPDLRIELAAGAKAQKVITLFRDTPAAPLDTLKGMAAHVGPIVQAKVRIVRRDYSDSARTQEQIDAMEEGEVLVSETTDPELMGAFHKASAVVTDVGGMLSHAAITSREMNLPCIVGTGNASKVLKTGDLVEVDAGKGTVTIIKRT